MLLSEDLYNLFYNSIMAIFDDGLIIDFLIMYRTLVPIAIVTFIVLLLSLFSEKCYAQKTYCFSSKKYP